MGSTVSLAVGLLLTWIVTRCLPRDAVRFALEQAPLLEAVVVFTLFAAASAASFYGDLRSRRWRYKAYAATLVMFATTVWLYWPSKGP